MNLQNKARALSVVLTLTVLGVPTVHAQAPTDLSGTWQAETPDGPQTVVVRSDSSASFGEEMIRWRIVADTVFLVLGGEWIGYNFRLRGRTLTLSGGDLEEPVELQRVGPPTPRPEGVPVPPDPNSGPPAVSGSP
ncbi:MAG: hypothetical protein OER90_13080 [Gemmatimonadota bacterium]|nr:hypothetical protein [Gemmatimonadota bacterium]